MRANRSRKSLVCLAALALLAACSSTRKVAPDDAPTLKTLADREVKVDPDAGLATTPEKAIAAYRAFLEASPKAITAPQRAEALRRLGDLEMDRADERAAADGKDPDYREAVTRYHEYLKAHPGDKGNDRVLYQLARAQEQTGDLATALKTLDRLIAEHADTAYRDEAQFRRGELLFTARDYPKAEAAFAAVLRGGDPTPYHDRSLYMHGWSQFKQGRLDEALHSFFEVLDGKLAGRDDAVALEELGELTRADRELVEDTFRVMSLSLQNLQGAETITRYVDSDARRSYEVRVYRQLAELYLKQERVKDAADTLAAFSRRNPLHAQAPVAQSRVIEIYQAAGFATPALEAKKDYVVRYGVGSDFRRANPEGWARAQPLVKTHLTELARHHHALAQKGKAKSDIDEAVRWYRAYIVSYPDDKDTPGNHFLLAELLTEDRRPAEAAAEYERVAYAYPPHARSADAGYSALLAYAAQRKAAAGDAAAALDKASVESSLRFAAAFPGDTRAGPVLTTAAEMLFAQRDVERAEGVARQVLALKPAASEANRRVAWTVLAHAAFERGAFDAAEKGYVEVLALKGEPAIVERLAASIYKQGEKARADGDLKGAVAHFARVGSAAPGSGVQAAAQYDGAAALLALKDWAGAARALEDFRQRYPKHELAAGIAPKLALAYGEAGDPARAAVEYERIGTTQTDPKLAQAALWQAAELHQKAGARAQAVRLYERIIGRAPAPDPAPKTARRGARPAPAPAVVPSGPPPSLELAVEARWRLAQIARADGQTAREFELMREIFHADAAGGAARTERTKFLGATAALALAAPALEAYRGVVLVEPLQKSLKTKKAKLEEVLRAYATATEYGVAEVTTAATFHSAGVYAEFGRALMNSQRPKKLSKVEREQYDVMLEEQAFPFEEKALQLHEVNAKRAASGVYDEWVKKSFDELARMRPVRYAKPERGADASHRALAELERDTQAENAPATAWNRLGVAQRKAGHFDKARQAYEHALVVDPAAADAVLNLGILHDLYLGNAALAQELYARYLALTPAGDATVSKWVADLKNRKSDRVALDTQVAKEKP